jgi:hypothetical protein
VTPESIVHIPGRFTGSCPQNDFDEVVNEKGRNIKWQKTKKPAIAGFLIRLKLAGLKKAVIRTKVSFNKEQIK